MRNGRPWAVRIMPIIVASFAALVVGYGLGEQAQLGEQPATHLRAEERAAPDRQARRRLPCGWQSPAHLPVP